MDPNSVRSLYLQNTRPRGQINLPTLEFIHEWPINDFEMLRTCGREMFITSPIFSPEGNDDLTWFLKLYPRGDDEVDLEPTLVLELGVRNNTLPAVADFEIRIYSGIGPTHSILMGTMTQSKPSDLSSKLPMRLSRRIRQVDFFRGGRIQNNFTIICKMVFNADGMPISVINNPVEVQVPRILIDDMRLLLKNHYCSDVTLTVSGKDIQAHKAILAARSSVFAAMFEHDMKESNENKVEISDIDHEVFTEVLRFVYTDEAMNLKKLAVKLLTAADKYALNTLKYRCAEILSKNLTIENAVDVILLADLHGVDELKTTTVNFICLHMNDIIDDTTFKTMSRSSPDLVVEILRAMTSRFNKLNNSWA